MAGEKARITEEIIKRIEAHEYEDTVQYIELYMDRLGKQLIAYDADQAEILKRKIEKKTNDTRQSEKHFSSELNWKTQTDMREVRKEQINKLKDKAIKRLKEMLGTKEYLAYLELAKAKAPKTGTFYVRKEDLEYFRDVDTKIAIIPLGGFKVVDGSKVIDFTMEIAFKEVFDVFANTLNIDEQE